MLKPKVFYVILVFYSVSSFGSLSWWNRATFYEIFVRSFQDSDGDGHGDLRGITQRLNYLQSLGIQGIWLTPIFPSRSYHGYDATDYYTVDPQYGRLEDFNNLVKEAHTRGIRVILDIAVNHTSDSHPWFSQLHDWYVWREKPQPWGNWYPIGNEYYYSVFDRSMPNLNWRNPMVLKEVKALLKFWMRQGADGFRLDAARYYAPGPQGEADTIDTHQAIAAFASDVRSEFPEVLFIGEIWADSATIHSYCQSGRELDLGFNFPLSFPLIDTLNSEDPEPFARALREYELTFQDPRQSAPFLTNHDMTRTASMLWNYLPKIKLAAEVYFMLPGTPFLYYGEELGLPNGQNRDDRDKRQPMQWENEKGFGFSSAKPWYSFYGEGDKFSVAAQKSQPDSVLELYRKLIQLRNGSNILSQGNLSEVKYHEGLLQWTRTYQEQKALVVVNFSYLPSNPQPIAPHHKVLNLLYGSVKPTQDVIPSLPPHSVHVFRVE